MSEKQLNFPDKADPLGYYAVLHVRSDADAAVIKQNYRDLAKVWHPDHNTDAAALENFQKISVAYEVLKDERRRLFYDLLSMIYTAENFPEFDTITPFAACGSDSPDVRALNLYSVRGRLWKSLSRLDRRICTENEARSLEFKTALFNWLLGWWNPRAFFQNIKALLDNFKNVNAREDNFRVLVHNAVAFAWQQKNQPAAVSAVLALSYAQAEQKLLLQKLIAMLDTRVAKPKRWNYFLLQALQLVIPLILMFAALLPSSVEYVTQSELMRYFSEKNQIDYYQEVRFGRRGSSFDDMVVGKVINIPVDRSDAGKLYHLKTDTVVMYGPSEEFDVLKKLPKNTTVRLTGMTPDDIWYRIMIDNGEMGFVPKSALAKGVGNAVPYGSRIIDPQ